MNGRQIGVDIGTSALRAAEVRVNRGQAELIRFGQLSLPEGAVVEGEIHDSAAVAGVLRELWESVGFSSNEVVLGVNTQRLVVRTFEVPIIDDPAELESTVRFEALEQLAIPLDEAVLDFEVIGQIAPDPDDEDSEPKLRVLVAATPSDVVEVLLQTAKQAGLVITAIDPAPLALSRGLYPDASSASTHKEAIVSVGSGLTSVTVHEAGTPQFVRILRSGTSGIRNALTETHKLELEMAEAMKRAVSSGDVSSVDPKVIDTLNKSIAPLVEEIRGSIDFYAAQGERHRIERVILAGGGSRVRGISDRLKRELNVDVDPAHPLLVVDATKTEGFDRDTLIYLEPVLLNAIGHALWAMPADKEDRRINLIPDVARHQSAQREQIRKVVSLLTTLAVVLGLGWGVSFVRTATVRHNMANTKSVVNKLTAQQASLKDVSDLRDEKQKLTKLRANALKGDVSWTQKLRQMAAVQPKSIKLTTWQVQKGDVKNNTETKLDVQGVGTTEHDVAEWLTGIKTLPWAKDAWISNTQKGAEGTLTFTATMTVDEAFPSARTQKFAAEAKQ